MTMRCTPCSVVFLFMVHPFDVGDTLLINGDTHKVHKHKRSAGMLCNVFAAGAGRADQANDPWTIPP